MLRIVISGIALAILSSHLRRNPRRGRLGRIWCHSCGRPRPASPRSRCARRCSVSRSTRSTPGSRTSPAESPSCSRLRGRRSWRSSTAGPSMRSPTTRSRTCARRSRRSARPRPRRSTRTSRRTCSRSGCSRSRTISEAVLDLDEDGRARTEAGPWQPLASDQVEIFAISNKTGYEAFTAFLFDRDAWPLAGAMLESGPTAAALMPALKEPSARRQFAFMSAMQLLRGLSRARSRPPGLGPGRTRARDGGPSREQGSPERGDAPAGQRSSEGLGSFVGDLVAGGKVRRPRRARRDAGRVLSVRSRLQAWSLVRWMMEKDRQVRGVRPPSVALVAHRVSSEGAPRGRAPRLGTRPRVARGRVEGSRQQASDE